MNPELFGDNTHEAKPLSQETLALAFEYLHTKNTASLNAPDINESLTRTIRETTDTPFTYLDSVSLGHSEAEFDSIDNTVYPEVFSATVHGLYGVDGVSERSLSLVVARDPHGNTYEGFVTQAFHDAESYPLDEKIGSDLFMRSVANNPGKAMSADTIPITSVGGDYKRTSDLRTLEQQDLELLLQLFEQKN